MNRTDVIDDYIQSQPYKVSCMSCGSILEFESEVDNDGDLTIRVEPCNCIKE
jgi:hypothetical protein